MVKFGITCVLHTYIVGSSPAVSKRIHLKMILLDNNNLNTFLAKLVAAADLKSVSLGSISSSLIVSIDLVAILYYTKLMIIFALLVYR
jgi:hypothetical protein